MPDHIKMNKVFAAGLRAAKAGKPIYLNPHAGDTGQRWFAGYRAASLPKYNKPDNNRIDRIIDDLHTHGESTAGDVAARLNEKYTCVSSTMYTAKIGKKIKLVGKRYEPRLKRNVNLYNVV